MVTYVVKEQQTIQARKKFSPSARAAVTKYWGASPADVDVARALQAASLKSVLVGWVLVGALYLGLLTLCPHGPCAVCFPEVSRAAFKDINAMGSGCHPHDRI